MKSALGRNKALAYDALARSKPEVPRAVSLAFLVGDILVSDAQTRFIAS
jgi:hypothetical protein